MTCLDRWQHLPRIRLALVPLFACLFAAEVQGLVLAQGGKTDHHIYVAASAAPAERRAAEELAIPRTIAKLPAECDGRECVEMPDFGLVADMKASMQGLHAWAAAARCGASSCL